MSVRLSDVDIYLYIYIVVRIYIWRPTGLRRPVSQIYVFTRIGFDLEESCSYAVHLEISFKVMLATFLLSEVEIGRAHV